MPQTAIPPCEQCQKAPGHVRVHVVYGQTPESDRDDYDVCMACVEPLKAECEANKWFSQVQEIIPVVGLGAFVCIGSDRSPYTVVEVVNDKTIVIQEDDYEGEFAVPDGKGGPARIEHRFKPNPQSARQTWTLRKDGRWREKNSPYGGLYLGERRYYRDPSF